MSGNDFTSFCVALSEFYFPWGFCFSCVSYHPLVDMGMTFIYVRRTIGWYACISPVRSSRFGCLFLNFVWWRILFQHIFLFLWVFSFARNVLFEIVRFLLFYSFSLNADVNKFYCPELLCFFLRCTSYSLSSYSCKLQIYFVIFCCLTYRVLFSVCRHKPWIQRHLNNIDYVYIWSNSDRGFCRLVLSVVFFADAWLCVWLPPECLVYIGFCENVSGHFTQCSILSFINNILNWTMHHAQLVLHTIFPKKVLYLAYLYIRLYYRILTILLLLQIYCW